MFLGMLIVTIEYPLAIIESLSIFAIPLIILILVLVFINKKFNLLDAKYPVSRRIFNGFFIVAMTIVSIIATWTTMIQISRIIHDSIPQTVYSRQLSNDIEIIIDANIEVPIILALLVACLLVVILANIKPILVSTNSKTTNAVNFFSLCIGIGVIAAIFEILIQIVYKIYLSDNEIYPWMRYYDAGPEWKIIIFLACILLGLGVLIYCLNFRKKKSIRR